MIKNVVYSITTLIFFFITGCGEEVVKVPREGNWRAVLEVKDNRELPFTFRWERGDSTSTMWIFNAGEVIEVDDISIRKDSLYIRMPVFEEYISTGLGDTLLRGNLINESRGRKVPFVARYGDMPRFPVSAPPGTDVSGEWEVIFSPGTADQYPAKGIFTREGEKVHGTFRTRTGDRRYLEGVVSGDSLKLSTFDGTHAYLFVAEVSDSLMHGTYYSGNHFKQPFEGRRNAGYELPDENTLTFLRDGYDRFDFNFPDTEGNMVSLSDPRFQGKVVIVQLMGSWCPNCLDETRFLTSYLAENKDPDLQMVALAFEYAKTEEKALAAIRRLKSRVGVGYPILLAQFGGADKEQAGEKLPMLNHVLSYPTTLYIDREGQVRRIHTGFNGPATGDKYEVFKREFDSIVREMLSE